MASNVRLSTFDIQKLKMAPNVGLSNLNIQKKWSLAKCWVFHETRKF